MSKPRIVEEIVASALDSDKQHTDTIRVYGYGKNQAEAQEHAIDTLQQAAKTNKFPLVSPIAAEIRQIK